MIRYLFFLLFILHFTLFIFHSSSAKALEVSGYITEDTVWFPENNPYHVVDHIIINPGVTLRILPGTRVEYGSARLMVYEDQTANFGFFGEHKPAKSMKIHGTVIAIGTEQDSIIFTRDQNIPYYHWGTNYFHYEGEGETNIFQYCHFEYSANVAIAPGNPSFCALDFRNQGAIVQNCTFYNCHGAVDLSASIPVLAIDNKIIIEQPIYTANPNQYAFYLCPPEMQLKHVISNNKIIMRNYPSARFIDAWNPNLKVIIAHNKFQGNSEGINCYATESYIYRNTFRDSCDLHDISYKSVIKENYFSNKCSTDILSDTLFFVSNYATDCFIKASTCSGVIANNMVKSGWFSVSAGDIFNNIVYSNNNIGGFTSEGSSVNPDYFYNNVCVGADTGLLVGGGNAIFCRNCIFLNNLSGNSGNGGVVFTDCIIQGSGNKKDEEVTERNIYADSADSIFINWRNGDFRLRPNSIAIDAGGLEGDCYPFDYNYSARVWDGNEDGEARIDIGALEFGSPPFSEISGYIYDAESGEPVPYVFLQFGTNPIDYCVSDSTGYYEIRLVPDEYTVYLERPFYVTDSSESISVLDGIDDEFNFVMECTLDFVDVNEEFIIQNSELIINNYPNPFNPSSAGRSPVTRISFNLPVAGEVQVTIYNIKGQKVKNLLDDKLDKGRHSVAWNGDDEAGTSVSSGVYMCRVVTDSKSAVRKMLLLK